MPGTRDRPRRTPRAGRSSPFHGLRVEKEQFAAPTAFRRLRSTSPPETKKAFLDRNACAERCDRDARMVLEKNLVNAGYLHHASGGSTRIRTWDLPVMSR